MDFDEVHGRARQDAARRTRICRWWRSAIRTRATPSRPINDDVDEVEKILPKAFAGKLKTYQVEVTDVKPMPGDRRRAGRAIAALARNGCLPSLPLPLSYVTLLQAAPTPDDAAASDADDRACGDADGDADRSRAAAADARRDRRRRRQPTTPAPNRGNDAGDDRRRRTAAGTPTADQPTAATAADDGANPFAGGDLGHDQVLATSSRRRGDTSPAASATTRSSNCSTTPSRPTGHEGVAYRDLQPRLPRAAASAAFTEWDVKLALPEAEAQKVLDRHRSATEQPARVPAVEQDRRPRRRRGWRPTPSRRSSSASPASLATSGSGSTASSTASRPSWR